ncbi:MAG: YrbL family protein [Pseudomonadota bacterium]
MLFAAKFIDLSDTPPIATGGIRTIYECPGQPDLLIKVFSRPKKRYRPKTFLKRAAWALFPNTRFRNMLTEIESEYLASLEIGTDIEEVPLPRMLGVVQTSLGSGVLVERINGPDGGLAPQLYDVSRGGKMPEPMLDALNLFVSRIYDLKVVARDITGHNIVYGTRGAGMGFFLIDGYGERNIIPLRTLSRRLNNRSLNKSFAKVAQRTGLTWHQDRREFSAAS